MTNRQIASNLKAISLLLALHNENEFKVKMYDSASQLVKNLTFNLVDIPEKNLENIDGIGKKIASVIREFNTTETSVELNELLSKTPQGLIELLNLKGIGPKKVRSLWQELNIESLEDLILHCEKGSVAQLKGFGDKTQDKILAIAHFTINNRGKVLYSNAEQIAAEFLDHFGESITLVGEFARGLDVISKLQFLIADKSVFSQLENCSFFSLNKKASSPYTRKGEHKPSLLKIEFIYTENLARDRFVFSSGEDHLGHTIHQKTVLQHAQNLENFSEKALYDSLNLPLIPIGSREGLFEFNTTENQINKLIQFNHLKGVLHNHSTWSDGLNTIEEMALECKRLGYHYFGISDHSKSAFYANGLSEERIFLQQAEIDHLNKKYPDFKIFKGIEADILTDGNLDYSDEVLKTFDFVVASVHSVLDMDLDKAMVRLIKAIENPYTTFLGHPTGRLLLKREGYPLNHKMIIDACAANNVIIELNANPWRLDLDYKYIPYAMEKGVMLSINPDAHYLSGILDMKFGVVSALKGGLTKDFCFNTKTTQEVEQHFKAKQGK